MPPEALRRACMHAYHADSLILLRRGVAVDQAPPLGQGHDRRVGRAPARMVGRHAHSRVIGRQVSPLERGGAHGVRG
jgi:hypothetical protein